MKESYDTVKLLADSGPRFAGVLPAKQIRTLLQNEDIMHVKDCNGINPATLQLQLHHMLIRQNKQGGGRMRSYVLSIRSAKK